MTTFTEAQRPSSRASPPTRAAAGVPAAAAGVPQAGRPPPAGGVCAGAQHGAGERGADLHLAGRHAAGAVRPREGGEVLLPSLAHLMHNTFHRQDSPGTGVTGDSRAQPALRGFAELRHQSREVGAHPADVAMRRIYQSGKLKTAAWTPVPWAG